MNMDQINSYAIELRLIPVGGIVPIAMVPTLIRQLEAAAKILASTDGSVWVVLDEDGQPDFVVPYEEMGHEHINEAIADNIEGARLWVVREYRKYAIPEQSEEVASLQLALQDYMDACNYADKDTLISAIGAAHKRALELVPRRVYPPPQKGGKQP